MGRVLKFTGVPALILAAALAVIAQTTAGSLSGTVVDTNGAAVAAATVTITDNATNQSRTAQTNTQGKFRFSEDVGFEIRAEAFNLLNRANVFIGNVSGTPAGTSFNINSTNFGRVNTTFDPRIIQFVGRFEF